jgi:hypothetical protein
VCAGVYYVLTSHCCCFCQQGSGDFVYTAASPLGPYTRQAANLACVPSEGDPMLEGEAPLAATRGEASTLADADAQVAASVDAASGDVGGIPTPGQGCLYNGSTDVSVTRSQTNYVTRVDTPSGPVLVWSGDRWQQSPDGVSRIAAWCGVWVGARAGGVGVWAARRQSSPAGSPPPSPSPRS